MLRILLKLVSGEGIVENSLQAFVMKMEVPNITSVPSGPFLGVPRMIKVSIPSPMPWDAWLRTMSCSYIGGRLLLKARQYVWYKAQTRRQGKKLGQRRYMGGAQVSGENGSVNYGCSQ